MRIVDPKGLGSVSAGRATRSSAPAGGARFSLQPEATTARAEQAAPASILGGLEALIAIQSDDQSRNRKKRGVRRGQGLLDILDDLKISLLAGRLPPDIEQRLQQALRDEGLSGDPRLDSILDGIELRAAVELAKLRVAKSAREE